MADITSGERIILALSKEKPSKMRVLYPLLKSEKARLLALKIRKDTLKEVKDGKSV